MSQFSDLPIELAERIVLCTLAQLEPTAFTAHINLSWVSRPIRFLVCKNAFRVLHSTDSNWGVLRHFLTKATVQAIFGETRMLFIHDPPYPDSRLKRLKDALVHVQIFCATQPYYSQIVRRLDVFVGIITDPFTHITAAPRSLFSGGVMDPTERKRRCPERMAISWTGSFWFRFAFPPNEHVFLAKELEGLKRVVLFVSTHYENGSGAVHTMSSFEDALRHTLTFFLGLPTLLSIALCFPRQHDNNVTEQQQFAAQTVAEIGDPRVFLQERDRDPDYVAYGLDEEAWTKRSAEVA